MRELEWLARAQRQVVEAAARFVEAARDEGRTWAQIGAVLGISASAARSAYAARERRADRLREDLVWFPGGVPAKYASSRKLGMRRPRGRRLMVLSGPVDTAGARQRSGAPAVADGPCGLPPGHPVWHPDCRCPVAPKSRSIPPGAA